MLLQILKKDMLKRKGVNFILFLFITLATIFLASSINNIMIVGSAVDYYMDYANVPDNNVILSSEKDKDKIDAWLDTKVSSGLIEEYDYNRFLEIADKSVEVKKDGKNVQLDNRGASLFLSTMDVDYCKVFNNDGQEFILKEGEIAVGNSMMDYADLKIGDKLKIKDHGVEKEFIIKVAVKDAAFGSEMVGMIRFILNENDFRTFEKESTKLGLYYVSTSNSDSFTKELSSQGFAGVMNNISIDTYKMVYSFDMIIAGLLIVIGIVLILIALLVLRFTLVFTLEEQYQEIGILKAVGLRNFAIKKLYLVKYLAIVTVGTILGAIISGPVSQMMLDSVNKNMIMASSELNFGVNILCALFIVVLVLSFCYFCTKKLNKVSAITAIRGGYTGERFHARRGIRLSKSSRLSVPLYLGFNDILSHLTRYIVLIITFCLSFILITIPLNTINTMKSDEMVRKFYIDPDSSVYLRKIEEGDSTKYYNSKDLMEGVERVKDEMKDKGYDVEMSAIPIYFMNYNSLDNSSKLNIMTVQLLGKQRDYAEYSDGKAPILENEIA
ncbi:MAG: ABC transporter permease, partial [Coprobacillus sp.]